MVGLAFYENPQALQDAISAGTPSKVVYDSSLHFLGFVGGISAVLGVVVLPITSGDTAFRAARLQLAEIFKIDQRSLTKRLFIAVPLFVLGYFVSTIDFSLLWRYFTWANQMTAMVMLWTAAAYLYHCLCNLFVLQRNWFRLRLSIVRLPRLCDNNCLCRVVLRIG